MYSIKNELKSIRCWTGIFTRKHVSKTIQSSKPEFESVFTLPAVRYISLLQRLKVYHLVGSSFAIPLSGLLEMSNILTQTSCISTTYFALTTGVVLSLVTLPFRNVIGFLYVNEDDSKVKISFVDYWGKRNDRIIATEEWIPLTDLPRAPKDIFYLTPKLEDGTEYKLFIKFGKITSNKMGVLE